MWKNWNPHTLSLPEGMKNGVASVERSLWLRNKLNTEFLYDPEILLLGINPKELKISVQTKTYTQIFIAALFTIGKRWKQHKCPSMDE